MPKNIKKKQAGNKKFLYPIMAVILIVVIGGYLILTNTNSSEASNSKPANQQSKQFQFKKEGELTFQNSQGEFISKIDIEIANDMVERAVGLMYRDELGEDQGMFFVFPTEEYQSFWMRNTVLSLDILFVNKNREIVTIHKNTIPFSDESYPSTVPSIYVVEVNAGYTDKYGIKEGDKISWRLN